LKETIREFSLAGTKVWILKDVPNHEMIVPRALALHAVLPAFFPDPQLVASTSVDHRMATAVMDSFTSELVESGATVIDPAPLLLNDNGRHLVVDGDICLYGDVGHHLSIEGALRLVPLFEPLFTKISP
jgi:hypothetical protein